MVNERRIQQLLLAAEARRRVALAHELYPWAEGLSATVLAPPEGPFVLTGPATDVEASKLRHSAASFRRMLDGLLGQHQGVVYSPNAGQDLRVLATGTPDGFVHVNAGACYVRGTQAAGPQGMYHLYNDATLDINVLGPNPAHATLDRIDLVVARVQDSFYSGSTDLPTIEMVTGTPSGSPVAPAAPANSLILAQLSIIHATATIPQSVITDKRTPAGTQPVLLFSGDTTGAAVASLTLPASGVLPPGFRELFFEYRCRDSGAGTGGDGLDFQFGTGPTPTIDTGANYDAWQWSIADNSAAFAAVGAQPGFGGTFARLGVTTQGGLANANLYDHGSVRIIDPNSTVEKLLQWDAIQKVGVAAGNFVRLSGFGGYRGLVPITAIKVVDHTGGSNLKLVYSLWGLPWV